jgi:diguanylate cyclase (GGDEF)-like protein/PAS domain S-box-containing protein
MDVVINGGMSMDDILCAHDAHQDELLTLRKQLAACELERDTLRQELAALRSERDYFCRIADGTYDWEYWRAPDGRHHYVSPSCERITGYTPDEFQADPHLLEHIIHADDREHIMHSLHDNQQCPQSHELTFRIVTRSGEACWIGHVCQPVYGSDGAWLGQRASNRDITAQKQAEQELVTSRALLQGVLNHAPLFIFAKDLEGRLTLANPQLERLFQVGRGEMLGKTDYDFHSSEIAAHNWAVDLEVQHTRQPVKREEYGKSDDGTLHTYLSIKFPLFDDDGNLTGTCGMATDITERKQMEEALRMSQSHLQALFDNAAVGIIEMTPDGRWLDVNQRALQMLGYTQHELSQRTYLDIIHPAERAHSLSSFSSVCRDGKQPARTERRYLCKDGTTFWGDLSLAAIRDEHGNITSILGILVNITRLKEAEAILKQTNAQLTQQATHDLLTGLYNRHYLDETLPRELQRATRHRRSSVGVIMLDIDHFKRFNDTYGHDGGDALLRAVGAFLQTNIRGEDIACRYGGEEFSLVLPGASLVDTQQRAEAIRAGVQALVVEHAGQALTHVTVSLGVAVFSDYRTTADMLIRAADQALYQAKRSGRNQVVSNARTLYQEMGRTNV